MLKNKKLKFFLISFFSLSLKAQDSLNPIREAFYDWGKLLRSVENFECAYKIEGQTNLLANALNSLTSLNGKVAYRLNDNSLEIITESKLGSYQINIYNNQAFELLSILGVNPQFTFYRNLSNTKISYLTECLNSLKQSEVAFHSCFDKQYNISLSENDPSAHHISMNSKNPDLTGIETVVIDIEHHNAFPKKISLKMKGSDKTESIIFSNFKNAPQLKNKRFSIPWPENADIFAVE